MAENPWRGRWNVVGRKRCRKRWSTEEEKEAKIEIISLRDDRISKRIQGRQTERGEREAGYSKLNAQSVPQHAFKEVRLPELSLRL